MAHCHERKGRYPEVNELGHVGKILQPFLLDALKPFKGERADLLWELLQMGVLNRNAIANTKMDQLLQAI